jgi:hypothetical protein
MGPIEMRGDVFLVSEPVHPTSTTAMVIEQEIDPPILTCRFT